MALLGLHDIQPALMLPPKKLLEGQARRVEALENEVATEAEDAQERYDELENAYLADRDEIEKRLEQAMADALDTQSELEEEKPRSSSSGSPPAFGC